MPNLDLARQLLYYSPALLQSLIVWRMTVTGSRRNFPIFYSYLIFQTAALIVGHLVISFGAGMQYRYFYSAQMIVGVTLLFAVIYEIFSNVFRPYEALHDFARVMFRWAGLVLALVALLQAFSTQAGQGDRLIVALVIAERSVVVIACGLLLFLLLFSKNLGLDWKHQAFGVATGFGLFCGIELILLTSQLLFGCPMGPTLNRLRASAWLCVVILWVYYMFGPERAHKTAEAFAPKLILERWNQVLRSVNRPAPQGSFMPNLEKIVDDVLAHQPTTGIVH